MTVTAGNADLLDLAREVALTAGRLVRERRGQGVEVAASKSSPEDIVTHADRESEALIRSLLAKARPDDGFLGEESDADAGSSGLTWVVDPIDGTVNFLYGIPHYAVSIAVVEGEPDPASWRALAAAVVNPAIGEVFTAADGGEPCAAKQCADRRGARHSQDGHGIPRSLLRRLRQAQRLLRGRAQALGSCRGRSRRQGGRRGGGRPARCRRHRAVPAGRGTVRRRGTGARPRRFPRIISRGLACRGVMAYSL